MENRGEGSCEASGPSVSSGVTSLGLLAWGAGLPLEQALSWRLARRSIVSGLLGRGEGEAEMGRGSVGLPCSLRGGPKPQPTPRGDKEGAGLPWSVPGWGLLREGVTLGGELSLALVNPQEIGRWENRGLLPEEDPRGSSPDHHIVKEEN